MSLSFVAWIDFQKKMEYFGEWVDDILLTSDKVLEEA